MSKHQKPSVLVATLPIFVTVFLLVIQLFYYDDFTPHIPIVLGLAFTALVGYRYGYTWREMQEGIFHVIGVALPSVSILLLVGMAIGVWIGSGTVPSMIYYGLELIDPKYFLASTMIVCSFVSVCLGTSWGTVGTVGLALIGIGSGFGFPAYWVAGAVVSGAFFGDKISPLSDTTNLASAVAGVDLFEHIKNLLPTTIPSMLIALILYTVVGFFMESSQTVSVESIDAMRAVLKDSFNISVVTLLPIAIVIGLAVKKMPAIPSIFAGVFAAGILIMVENEGMAFHNVMVFANSGYSIKTAIPELNTLLNRGGVQSMTWIFTLVMFALALGGTLERTRCLEVILAAMVSRIKTFTGLQILSTLSSFLTNLISGDVYLSIALPGRTFAPAYRRIQYSTKNLSRSLEEGGTLLSPLIPWNVGGAFVISALGLGIFDGQYENLLYIPLSFACWLSPVVGILYSVLGKFSPKATKEEIKSWKEKGEEILKL